MTTPPLGKHQKNALHDAAKGPLFLRGKAFTRPGAKAHGREKIDALIDRGFFTRHHTRHGVPYVVITDAGRAAIGRPRHVGGARITDREAIEAAAALRDRITP